MKTSHAISDAATSMFVSSSLKTSKKICNMIPGTMRLPCKR